MTSKETAETGNPTTPLQDGPLPTNKLKLKRAGWGRRGLSLLLGARTNKGIISLADQMVASATNFLTGVIIARNCSKEEFGLYMLGFSIVLFVLDLQTSLISSPYMVYSPRFTGRRHAAYMGSSMIQQLLLALLVLIALTAGIAMTARGLGPDGLRPVLIGLSVAICSIMFREFIRRISFAALEMTTAFVVDCTVALVQLGLLLLFAFYGLLTAQFAFYGIGVACTLSFLGWLYCRRNAYLFQKNILWTDCRKNLSFGKWIFASSLLWALSMSLYPWLLAFFHGTASTGVWAACWGVIAIANPLLLGIQNFLGPKIVESFTHDGQEGLYRFVQRVSLLYAAVIMPLAIILFIIGGQLVALFYGEKYEGNGPVISILAVYLLVAAASFTLSRALLTLERVRTYFMANIVPLIVMLTFGIYLIKKLGVAGVALGLLTGMTTTAVMMSVIFIGIMRTDCRAGIKNG